MEYYRSIRTSFISQNFGESKACVYPNRKVVGKILGKCPMNSTDFYKAIGMLYHNGEDHSCPHRAWDYFDVLADTDWEAVRCPDDYAGGKGVDVFSLSPIKIENFSRIAGPEAMDYYRDKGWYNEATDECQAYIKRRGWHYDEHYVHSGTRIALGDKIARCGTTGGSSGDHLHKGFKIVTEDRVTLDRHNGTTGAVNLEHLRSWKFVLDVLEEHEDPKRVSDHLYHVGWRFGNPINQIFKKVGRTYQIKGN